MEIIDGSIYPASQSPCVSLKTEIINSIYNENATSPDSSEKEQYPALSNTAIVEKNDSPDSRGETDEISERTTTSQTDVVVADEIDNCDQTLEIATGNKHESDSSVIQTNVAEEVISPNLPITRNETEPTPTAKKYFFISSARCVDIVNKSETKMANELLERLHLSFLKWTLGLRGQQIHIKCSSLGGYRPLSSRYHAKQVFAQ